MKKAIAERYLVVLLFVAVLITFSFAERDSKKLHKLYSYVVKTFSQTNITAGK